MFSKGKSLLNFFQAALCGLAAMLASTSHADPQVLAQVNQLNKAENALQTSTGRTFVSTKGAIHELIESSDGKWSAQVVPARRKNSQPLTCYFTGLAEYANTLYAVCTENNLLAFAPKYLVAMDLSQPGSTLQEIAPLRAWGLPNGLASDGAGHLYYANTAVLTPGAGAVWRITLSSRFTVSEEKAFHTFPLSSANGLKFRQNKLYVSTNPVTVLGLSQLLRYDVSAAGLTNKAVVYQSLKLIDDFSLVQGGLLIAEFLGNRIVHTTETGQVLHSASFSSPSSAHLINSRASGKRIVLVTEAGANRVSLIANDWNLLPR